MTRNVGKSWRKLIEENIQSNSPNLVPQSSPLHHLADYNSSSQTIAIWNLTSSNL